MAASSARAADPDAAAGPLPRRLRHVQPGAVVVRVATSTWALGCLIFLATWPVVSLTPKSGLDPSWRAGLYMAVHDHLRFGPELVFTYGPLGFLRSPLLYYIGLTRLAGLYVGIVHLALCLSVLWALRRSFPLVLAAALAFVVSAVLVDEAVLALAAIWSVEVLRGGGSERVRRLYPIVGGLVSGVEVLVKVNAGVTVLVICALTVACLPGRRWRSVAEFAGGFVVALLGCWLAAGQRIGDIGDYALNAVSVASGYANSMFAEAGPRWEYWAAILAVALVGWVALDASRLLQPARRLAMLAVLGLLAFSLWKAAFVRHDAIHVTPFFATMLAGLSAFAWRRQQQGPVLLSGAVLLVAYFGAAGTDPADVFNPAPKVKAAVEQLRTVTDSSRHGRQVADAHAGMQSYYALPPPTLAALQGHTVHVEPWETALVWAYGLRWRPVPVFHSYAAYTRRLDELNADFLASKRAPERILREVGQIDERNPQFDPPAATREMLCRYRQVAGDAHWQVLARGPTRCGRPSLLSRIRARTGVPVPVPASPAGAAVFFRVSGLEAGALERLQSFLLRGRERRIALQDGRSFRFLPLTAQDGTLLSVPRRADWPKPFSLSADARSVSITIGRRSPGPRRTLTYRFYALPISAG